MRSDDLLSTGEYFPNYDPYQHLETILGMLMTLLQWRNSFDEQTERAKRDGDDDSYVDGCVKGTYADVSFCHTAVAALAPMYEGMFAHEFRTLHAVYGDATPEGSHRRCQQAVGDFWNPKLYFDRKGSSEENIQRGSIQILTALDLLGRFPADLTSVTEALFTYRNRALHTGYEWLDEKRTSFQGLIKEKGWDDWFSWATTSRQGATVPWIAYMKDSLIRDCFNIASDSVVAFEAIRREQFARLPQAPPPAWMANLSTEHDFPVFRPVRWADNTIYILPSKAERLRKRSEGT